MGNLLSHEESFRWTDPAIDRGNQIKTLNEVLVKAKEYEDNIFRTEGLETLTLEWGNFREFFFNYAFDDMERQNIFPWMGQIEFWTLFEILKSFSRRTSNNASDLATLQSEFPNQNNAMTGFPIVPVPAKYVECNSSLFIFHSQYVARFTFQQQKDKLDYFKTFYIPELTMSLQQFQSRITSGQVHHSIKRIDNIRNPVHDKIHVHFNGGENIALNIDGTWRHPPSPNFTIKERAKLELAELGFMLPDEYYK